MVGWWKRVIINEKRQRYFDRMENIDHDPSNNLNLMQNMEEIECDYNHMGLQVWARRGI